MSSDFLSMFEKKLSLFREEFDDFINKELIPLSRFTERDDKWLLELDLPFVKKKDIDITLTSHHLVVKAKLGRKYCVSKLNCITEFNYFKKTLPLPPGIDSKRISAKFGGGILRVFMPKIISGKKLRIE